MIIMIIILIITCVKALSRVWRDDQAGNFRAKPPFPRPPTSHLLQDDDDGDADGHGGHSTSNLSSSPR